MADAADTKMAADALAALKTRIGERRKDMMKMKAIAVLESKLNLPDTGLLGLVDAALNAMTDMEGKIDKLPSLQQIIAKQVKR